LLVFRLFVFIVGVLEMPKGPETDPLCAVDVCGGRELSGEQFRLLRGVVQDLSPGRERLTGLSTTILQI